MDSELVWTVAWIGFGLVLLGGFVWALKSKSDQRKQLALEDPVFRQLLDVCDRRVSPWLNHARIMAIRSLLSDDARPTALYPTSTYWLLACEDELLVILGQQERARLPLAELQNVEEVTIGSSHYAALYFSTSIPGSRSLDEIVFSKDDQTVLCIPTTASSVRKGRLRTALGGYTKKRGWPPRLQLSAIKSQLPDEAEVAPAKLYKNLDPVWDGSLREELVRKALIESLVDLDDLPRMRRFGKGHDVGTVCRRCGSSWFTPSDLINLWLDQNSAGGKLKRAGTKVQHAGNVMTPVVGWMMAGRTRRRLDNQQSLSMQVNAALRCSECGSQSVAFAVET